MREIAIDVSDVKITYKLLKNFPYRKSPAQGCGGGGGIRGGKRNIVSGGKGGNSWDYRKKRKR